MIGVDQNVEVCVDFGGVVFENQSGGVEFGDDCWFFDFVVWVEFVVVVD